MNLYTHSHTNCVAVCLYYLTLMNDFIHTKNKHLALDEMEYFVSDCIIYKVYFEMDISICLFIFV